MKMNLILLLLFTLLSSVFCIMSVSRPKRYGLLDKIGQRDTRSPSCDDGSKAPCGSGNVITNHQTFNGNVTFNSYFNSGKGPSGQSISPPVPIPVPITVPAPNRARSSRPRARKLQIRRYKSKDASRGNSGKTKTPTVFHRYPYPYKKGYKYRKYRPQSPETDLWDTLDAVDTLDQPAPPPSLSPLHPPHKCFCITSTIPYGWRCPGLSMTLEPRNQGHRTSVWNFPPMTWHQAKATCESFGEELIQLLSIKDYDMMGSFITSWTDDSWWVSIREESTSENPNNLPSLYPNFVGQNCVVIKRKEKDPKSHTLQLTDCNQKNNFMCQFKKTDHCYASSIERFSDDEKIITTRTTTTKKTTTAKTTTPAKTTTTATATTVTKPTTRIFATTTTKTTTTTKPIAKPTAMAIITPKPTTAILPTPKITPPPPKVAPPSPPPVITTPKPPPITTAKSPPPPPPPPCDETDGDEFFASCRRK